MSEENEWRPTMHLRWHGHFGYSPKELEQLWERGDLDWCEKDLSVPYETEWRPVRWKEDNES